MSDCPDCSTNEEAVGEGVRCARHEIERLRKEVEELKAVLKKQPKHFPCVMQARAEKAEKEIEVLREQRDNEAWYHAACLSVAEGVPGWECVKQPSLAMRSVQILRQERDELKEESLTIEPPFPCRCEYMDPSTAPIPDSGYSGNIIGNLCVWCALKKSESREAQALKELAEVKAEKEKEHENFLAAHRDNMIGANLLAESRTKGGKTK